MTTPKYCHLQSIRNSWVAIHNANFVLFDVEEKSRGFVLLLSIQQTKLALRPVLFDLVKIVAEYCHNAFSLRAPCPEGISEYSQLDLHSFYFENMCSVNSN